MTGFDAQGRRDRSFLCRGSWEKAIVRLFDVMLIHARQVIDRRPSQAEDGRLGTEALLKLIPRSVDRYGLQSLSYFRAVSINYVRDNWRTAGFRAI